MSRILRTSLALGIAATALAVAANAQVIRPSTPHAAFNFIPFGGSGQVCTQHQVFDATLWAGGPKQISALGFAANNSLNGQQYDSDITIKMGYTTKVPGQNPPVGLDSVLTNNPSGPMTQVFSARVSQVLVATGTEDFSFILRFDTPFCYDPALGNLLIELQSTWVSGADLSVSRTSGSAESSRAYNSTRFGNAASPTTATRMAFYEDACSVGCPSDFTAVKSGACPTANMISWTGAPANSVVRVLYTMNNGGGGNIPSGPCAGKQLCIGLGGITLAPNRFNSPGGSGATPNFVAPCGLNIQLITEVTCKTSNKVTL